MTMTTMKRKNASFLALFTIVALTLCTLSSSVHAVPVPSLLASSNALVTRGEEGTLPSKPPTPPNDALPEPPKDALASSGNSNATTTSVQSAGQDNPSGETEKGKTALKEESPSQGKPEIVRIATVLQTPTAAVLYDPEATWTAPMIPSGVFNPMPHIIDPIVKQDEQKPKSGKSETAVAAPPTNNNATEPAKPTEPVKPTNEAVKQMQDVAAKAQDALRLEANNTAAPAPAPSSPPAAVAPLPARRAFRLKEGESTGTLRKRQMRANTATSMTKRNAHLLIKREEPSKEPATRENKTESATACISDSRETLVPVTYNELELIKAGLLKLVPMPNPLASSPPSANEANSTTKADISSASTNATSASNGEGKKTCIDIMDTVVMVPVSERQMMGITTGELIVKSTPEAGMVVLITAAEERMHEKEIVNAGGSASPNGALPKEDEPGPFFDVVPVSKMHTAHPATPAAPIPPVVNAIANGAAAGTASSGPSVPPATVGEKRQVVNRKRGVTYQTQLGLERRAQPSKADNTSIIGNGQGKLKYGHKIHYNGAARHHRLALPASGILLFCAGIFALWL